MSCSHCGRPLSEAPSRFCPHCGKPVTPGRAGAPSSASEVPEPMAQAAQVARRAAESAGRGIQGALEDPRLLQHVPGRSLPLLGAALVALAILLSVLPIFSGIGLPWSAVMLTGSALVVARELRAAGRLLPASVERGVKVAEHPAFLPAFAALTAAHAFVVLSLGPVPLLWLLAAVVLGYHQWRTHGASLVREKELPRMPVGRSSGRWVLVGAAVCAVALFMPWNAGSHYGVWRPRLKYIDPDTIKGDDVPFAGTWQPRWDPVFMMTGTQAGRDRPLAPLAVLSLGGLLGLTLLRRARAALPSFTLPALAAGLTVWGLTGMSTYRLGPWVFLLGMATIDVAVFRGFLQPRGGGTASTGGGDPG